MTNNTQMKPPTGQQPNRYPDWLRYVIIALAIGFFYYGLFIDPTSTQGPINKIPYSEFKTLLHEGRVIEVVLRGEEIVGSLKTSMPPGPKQELGNSFRTRLPDFGDETLIPALEAQKVQFSIEEQRGRGMGMTLLMSLLPWVILITFFYFIYQRTSKTLGGGLGGPGELKRFLESPTRDTSVPEVTFADVAGQDNAKREVTEVVEFLKNPEQFRKLGAEVPRGILLMGAPGTGKTLLAKALAGEAGVSFFSISGSEFI